VKQIALIMALVAAGVVAQIPRVISYQGVIVDTMGNPVPDGFYEVAFGLYGNQTATEPLWEHSRQVALKGGMLSVKLGRDNPIDASLFSTELFLGVSIDGAEYERLALSAAAYAFNAMWADTARIATELVGFQSSLGQKADTASVYSKAHSAQILADSLSMLRDSIDVLRTLLDKKPDSAYSYAKEVVDKQLRDSLSILRDSLATLRALVALKADIVSTYTRSVIDSLLRDIIIEQRNIAPEAVSTEQVATIDGSKIIPDFADQHIRTEGTIASTNFGEVFQYRNPYESRYKTARLRLVAEVPGATSRDGSYGVFLVSVSARRQSSGKSGGAVAVLIVTKEWNGKWVTGLNQIAAADGYEISFETVENSTTRLEALIKTNNISGYYEAFSVVQIGYALRDDIIWSGEVDE